MTRIAQGAALLLACLSKNQKRPPRWTSEILEQNAWGRMVVRYDFSPEGLRPGEQSLPPLVAKFYNENDDGQSAYQVMRALQAALSTFPQPPVLGLPQAYAYDPKIRILAQAFVPGVPYPQRLSGQNDLQYFRLAGRALAFLHGLKIAPGKEKGIEDHLRELIRPSLEIFCSALPQYQARVCDFIQGLKAQEAAWQAEISPGPLHRDFHLRQLFYEKTGPEKARLWLIDWDLFAKGDAALDVGNFVVYLKTHLKEGRRQAIAAFLKAYAADASPQVLKRVFLYQAFTYLRLACKCLWLKSHGWQEKAGAMLSLGEEHLLDPNSE